MKVAIYVRVSRSDLNIQNQLDPLIEYAKKMNYDYDVYEEKESTRKTRPVKYELYKKLRRKEYDAVLVYKLDRWAREVKEAVIEIDELMHKDVKFISITEGFDLTSPMGKFAMQVISAFAELERAYISERTRAGLRRAKARGKRLGRHPKKCKCGRCKQ